MESVHVLHLGCVSSVFLASKQPGSFDQDQKVVKAYHKGHLQVRHMLNITREVTHLRQLKELGVPGVVDLCGTADDASNIYLVFEPCFGGDLYKRLAHRGLYEEAQLCKEVVAPLLKVLHSLHALGIIHRDIKPENIFFDREGTLRLGDFGLAINAARERPISRVGTLEYMAPEVLAQPSADVIAVRKIKPAQLPSYDCKVDIWALGVLVYEALMGVTPFNDTDSQAACLKAQFRAPLPLPSVSPACADFVTQALAKQAAKRPSAAQLLGHPWVQAHMTSHEAQLYSEQASMQRAGSGGGGVLARASAGSHFTPRSSGSAAPVPIACSALMHGSGSSSTWELSSSAPTASPIALSAASSLGLGLPWQVPIGPSGAGYTTPKQQTSPLPVQKQQPQQTQPQVPPPHPFAAASVQYSAAARVLLGGALPPVGTADGSVQAAGCSLVLPPPGHVAALPLPMQHAATDAGARTFSRQLSSPARLRDAEVSQDGVAPSAEAPGSPVAPSSSSRISLDRIALAMSPMRVLLGAGRNLVRSRSGAAAPVADGSVAVPRSSSVAVAPPSKASPATLTGFNLRSPLPSPIRGLLQSGRRKPAATSSASTSLFAAAQWRPAASPAAANATCSTGSASSSTRVGCSAGSSHSTGADCGAGSGCDGGRKGLDAAAFMRVCSIGPNTVLGAGLCSSSQNSSTAPGLAGETAGSGNAASTSSSTGSPHAAAAVAAVGPHAKRHMGALACGPGGSGEQAAGGRKQQLALLNRYPSAPDPGPLLALSPVRGVPKPGGIPPAPVVPIDRAGSQGVRGVWLKMQGSMARMVSSSKPSSKDGAADHQDAHCVVSREA